MALNWTFPAVPPVQPGVAVQPAQVGQAAERLHAKLGASAQSKAVGGPGISHDELGSELIDAVQLAISGAALPLPQQEFQALVLEKLGMVRQQLGMVLQLSIESYNMGARLHNRSVSLADDLVKPLRKERQPGEPGAPEYGQLPPSGLFPTTHGEVLTVDNQQLDDLASYYEEDFGQAPAMAVAQRRELFERFICQIV